MAEPVIVPVQLEVTDIDMSNINFSDVQKDISNKMSTIKKSIADAFSGIDASAINKPIDAAMTSVKKSLQAAETAQLRYNEALIKAGESTKAYKDATEPLDSLIANYKETLAMYESQNFTWLPEYKELKVKLNDLLEERKQINPIKFVDDASPIQLEKVANAYKKVLSAQENVNKQTEKFNQTVKDNKTTDEYQEMVKEAESYKKKLDELNEKSKYMEKYGATDKQWEKARQDADWYSSKLDEVVKKMREAVTSGKALRFGDGPKGDLSRQINSLSMSGGNRAGAVRARAMANESPYTEEYQKALDELDKLEKKMEAIREKSDKMIELGASKKQFESLAYDAESLDVKIDEVKNHLMNTVNEGKAFKFGNGDADAEISKIRDKANGLQSSLGNVVTRAKKAQGGLTALGATHPKLAAVLGVVGKIATGFGKVMKVAGKVAKSIITGFSGAVKVLGKVASAAGRAVSSLFGRSGSNSTNSGIKKLTKNVLMWGFGFRTAYYAIKRLRNIFVESFKVMGDQFDEVGQPMMRMMESFNRLKGSLATAFQPLVSVVMPILTRFMNYLSGVLEGIGKFMATLTGQGRIYKAVAKNINSVADAAGNANDKLGSYDKLEVISKDSNNTGVDYEMQEVGAKDAASKFAQMVKEAWEKADFTSVGQYVTTQLLGVLEKVETNIVPKVTDFVNRILKSVNTFLTGFDATAIGTSFGSIINAIVTGLDWAQIGALFANLNNLVWGFFNGLVNKIDWVALGQAISTGLSSLVDTLDFNSLAGMYSGLTMGILTAIEQIDWNSILNKLLDGIQLILSSIGEAMKSSNNPIVSAFGDVILAINEVITIFRPVLEDLIAAFSPIIQAILPVISSLLPPIAEILATAAQMVLPVIVALFEAVMPIIGELVSILLPIILDLLTSLQPIFDALTNTVLPVIVHLLDVLMPLIKSVLGLITSILAPILALIGPLLEIVFSILDPVIIILEPIISVLTTICDVLGAVLRPILDALLPVLNLVSSVFKLLSPIISLLLTPLMQSVDEFKFLAGIITGTVVPVLDVLMGVVDLVANVFTAMYTTIGNALTGLKNAFDNLWSKVKGVFNSILGGVESLANGVIRGVNKIIKALNNLSFTVPDWIPGLGGKKFGFNIKEISEVKIPRLAQGAVIPPNKEFLAMLGDQRHGTNIEAPLDTIKQALAEVLAEIGGGNREPIVLQLDGRTVARVVWDEQEKRYKQTGRYSMA